MLFLERSDVYFHTRCSKPFEVFSKNNQFKYYLVSSKLDYKFKHYLSGLSFDNNKNIIFVVSESLDKNIREIIIKEYIYLLQLERVNRYDLITYLKKASYLNVENLLDLSIKYCEKCKINPKRYILYKIGIFLHMIDEMESKYQDITDIQLAIDFLTENLEYFICDPWQEDLLIKI